ncbi:hypothetical protein ABH968_003516 [Lysinibacillus sp. RC79]
MKTNQVALHHELDEVLLFFEFGEGRVSKLNSIKRGPNRITSFVNFNNSKYRYGKIK